MFLVERFESGQNFLFVVEGQIRVVPDHFEFVTGGFDLRFVHRLADDAVEVDTVMTDSCVLSGHFEG